MRDPFKLAEDGIVAELRAAFTSDEGALVREVETIPGEFTEAEATHILRSTPGVYVGLQQARRPEGQSGLFFEAIFAVFVVAHGTHEVARRRGEDGVSLGAYLMAAIAARALERFVIDEVGTVEVGDIVPVAIEGFARQGRSVYALRCKLPIDLAELDLGSLAEFRTFHADWDIQGGKVATTNLPNAEADADAQDTVEGLHEE